MCPFLPAGSPLHQDARFGLFPKVADNGKPQLSSLTYIDIRVIEESVYPPAILPLEIFITAFGEEYSGGVIGKIHATDQDVYDTLTYSLDPQMDNLFSVSSTGASRALCQAKTAPRAAFQSGCLAAQTKRWAEGIRVPL